MKVTEDYLKNVKELDKYLKTLCFDEESEKRIRAYVENPLSVVNDNIKRLFEKYDDKIVDYRIPLPASMIKQTRKCQKEIYLILSTIVDCLSEDNQLEVIKDENGNLVPNFSLTLSSITDNFFKVRNDKRKIWRYLDSKSSSIAKKVYETWLESKTFRLNDNGETEEIINIKENRFKLFCFFSIMNQYVSSLGSRKTSLKDKILKLNNSDIYNVTGMSDTEVINLITTNVIKPIFNIMQEIISAKLLDMDKFSLYLSFNVFDWMLASTGEDWHSCIDLVSSYAYGVGLLGMCGCPDWGMLLYTDNQKKESCGLSSFHIVTRSWVCYTSDKNFQMINWYPKNIRETIGFGDNEDFKFIFDSSSSRRSFSEWDPITFENGAVAWIYSDRNSFYVTNDSKKVYFVFDTASGLPRHYKFEGKIIPDKEDVVMSVINGVKHYSTIWEAVRNEAVIKKYFRYPKKTYHCGCCGNTCYSESELTFIPSENIYVCDDCLNNRYYECAICGEIHRYDDDSEEAYNGPRPWEYEIVCQNCLETRDDIFYDYFVDHYYFTRDVEGNYIKVDVQTSDGMHRFIASYNVEDAINAGRIRRDESGNLHVVEES